MTEHASEQNTADPGLEGVTVTPPDDGLIVNGLYSIHGLVTIAINANTLRPITSKNPDTSYEPNGQTSLLAAPGDEEWVLRMTRLRTALITDLSNEKAERNRLETHLTGLGEALRDEAIRREWCEEYDEFADSWGLPRLNRDYEVTMTITVNAVDEETALEMVRDSVGISSYSEGVKSGPEFEVSEA